MKSVRFCIYLVLLCGAVFCAIDDPTPSTTEDHETQSTTVRPRVPRPPPVLNQPPSVVVRTRTEPVNSAPTVVGAVFSPHAFYSTLFDGLPERREDGSATQEPNRRVEPINPAETVVASLYTPHPSSLMEQRPGEPNGIFVHQSDMDPANIEYYSDSASSLQSSDICPELCSYTEAVTDTISELRSHPSFLTLDVCPPPLPPCSPPPPYDCTCPTSSSQPTSSQNFMPIDQPPPYQATPENPPIYSPTAQRETQTGADQQHITSQHNAPESFSTFGPTNDAQQSASDAVADAAPTQQNGSGVQSDSVSGSGGTSASSNAQAGADGGNNDQTDLDLASASIAAAKIARVVSRRKLP